MDKTTPNYGLYLTDDGSANFMDWRKEINGSEDSNMLKIDTILGNKANASSSVYATLLASKWVGTEVPFSQEIEIPGMSKDQNGIIAISPGATASEITEARDASLIIASQSDSKLVIFAIGKKPALDIPVMVLMIG